MQLMLMTVWANQMQENSAALNTVGKAVGRMHTVKRVYIDPESVTRDSLEESRRKLGVEERDPWQLLDAPASPLHGHARS